VTYGGVVGLLGRLYEWQLPLERRALAAAAELAAVQPGERLLDVATGTGGLPRALAAQGARPGEAVGLDCSASMLAVAAAHLPSGWSLLRGDAKRLPFADQSFDLVSACNLLHLLGPDDRLRVLSEMARVLRPGGRLVTITTDSRQPVTRTLLARVPRRSGLRALDPSREFGTAGLRPLRARFVPSPWPSLCVLGEAPRTPSRAP
jgi:ubiquinone/menaquinone biosynthesis C-methylase UbiE